jgi:hypothetical protein
MKEETNVEIAKVMSKGQTRLLRLQLSLQTKRLQC